MRECSWAQLEGENNIRIGKINSQGLVIDFKDVKKILQELIDKFDHKYLNELNDFTKDNPTTENISNIILCV